jgi:hypothetical protein
MRNRRMNFRWIIANRESKSGLLDDPMTLDGDPPVRNGAQNKTGRGTIRGRFLVSMGQ